MSNPTQHPPAPGFGFARRNGADAPSLARDGAEVAYRDGVRPEVLAELRRYAGRR
jgi:general secretion pathway protein E